jgi:hypothetical protein
LTGHRATARALSLCDKLGRENAALRAKLLLMLLLLLELRGARPRPSARNLTWKRWVRQRSTRRTSLRAAAPG